MSPGCLPTAVTPSKPEEDHCQDYENDDNSLFVQRVAKQTMSNAAGQPCHHRPANTDPGE